MNKNIRKELLERYQATGRIGFLQPRNEIEALSMIESLCLQYEEPKEKIVLTLQQISEKLKEFLEKF